MQLLIVYNLLNKCRNLMDFYPISAHYKIILINKDKHDNVKPLKQKLPRCPLPTSNDNGVPVVGCQTGHAVQRTKYRPW